MEWSPPPKIDQLTETRLIRAILDGVFPINSCLPSERELAVQLGITRPTLRETLQRLERDGWVEIHQGKPTRVRNYWQEGNLGVLVAMALYQQKLPADFIPDLLNIRILLAPDYTRSALEQNPGEVLFYLHDYSGLADTAEAYARFDWIIHRQLTIASGNLIYICFINGMQRLYDLVGVPYFTHTETRAHSSGYYRELQACAQKGDIAGGFDLSKRIMTESRELWLKYFSASNDSVTEM